MCKKSAPLEDTALLDEAEQDIGSNSATESEGDAMQREFEAADEAGVWADPNFAKRSRARR